LKAHGTLYSKELGIDLTRNTPSALFRWLCASILFSAPISSRSASEAARALARAGWKTPRKMAASRWEDRVKVLNHAGYARLDESRARILGEVADVLVKRYRGDLRRLREVARQDPRREMGLLKDFKGLGEVGVGIFCREIQLVWGEVYPYADEKALAGAKRLRLGETPEELTRLVKRRDYPRLVTALVRMELAGDEAEIRETAEAS
jgi:hypothetical protein